MRCDMRVQVEGATERAFHSVRRSISRQVLD
jgi:hypothetical protein